MQPLPPNDVLIQKLKALQQEVSTLLSEVGATVAADEEQEEEPKADSSINVESKSMREAVNKIVAGTFDSGIADNLDNGVRALEASIKALDQKGIASNANEVLDEITYALESGAANPEDISDLKALAMAIGDALKNVGRPTGSTTPMAQPQQVSPPASAVKTISADEWKDLQSMLKLL